MLGSRGSPIRRIDAVGQREKLDLRDGLRYLLIEPNGFKMDWTRTTLDSGKFLSSEASGK
jgi:hypothetical protein